MAEGPGFSVNVDALKDAGLGLSDLLAGLAKLAVEDVDCDRRFVGHKGLADSYESFTTRWQVGVDNLTKDGEGLSKRLINAASMYIEADQEQARTLAGLLEPAPPTSGAGPSA